MDKHWRDGLEYDPHSISSLSGDQVFAKTNGFSARIA